MAKRALRAGSSFPRKTQTPKIGKKSDFNYPTDALKVAPTFVVNAERIEGFAITPIVVNSIYLEWEKEMDFSAYLGVCTFKAHSVLDLGHGRNVPDVAWGVLYTSGTPQDIF